MPLTRTLMLLGMLLAWNTAPQQAFADALETRIIQLQHRDADEVMPVLTPLLEHDGRISGRQYQLFVRTSERNFTELQRIARQIDTPLRTFRISVRFAGDRRAITAVQEVSGEQRIGDHTRIVLSSPAAGGGLVVRRGSMGGNAQYHVERRTSIRAQDGAQFVSVVEGRRAYIAVGQSVPQVQEFLILAGDRVVVGAGVTYHDVSTGFEVMARMHADDVDLEIAPRLAFLSERGSQIINFHELATHVTVKPGQWVDLGVILTDADQISRAILGASRDQAAAQHEFQVRVD